MADLKSFDPKSIAATCQENVAAITESLDQCFDSHFKLTVGQLGEFQTEAIQTDLTGPGLLVICQVEEHAVICAIPALLPLPPWYIQPGKSERACMDTLALEWSMNLLPEELASDAFSTIAYPNLYEALQEAEPAAPPHALPIGVGPDGEQSPVKLWLLWPYSKTPPEPVSAPESEPKAEPASQVAEPPVEEPRAAPRTQPSAGPLLRVSRIPVPVIVKLAERKINVGELLALSAGSIVTFEKSCEDLLDLMVNDQLYARGEAVKIGEKFGIKIAETGSQEIPLARVLD